MSSSSSSSFDALRHDALPSSESRESDSQGSPTIRIKNTFIDVESRDSLELRKKRSHSWSGSSSSKSSASGRLPLSSLSRTPASNHQKTLQRSEIVNSLEEVAAANSRGESREEIIEALVASLQNLLPEFATDSSELQDYKPKYGWSAGASSHETGKCFPCLQLVKRGGCSRRERCRFCHLEHDDLKKTRHRPCKATRDRCKHLLTRMGLVLKDDPVLLQNTYERLSANSPYIRSLLKSSLSGSLEDDSGGGAIGSGDRLVGVTPWKPPNNSRAPPQAPKVPGLQQPGEVSSSQHQAETKLGTQDKKISL
eukprot:TRINITY_DN84538_c0_g1_i1.p1 TRINITY_DN84538_c0_g1~~TRINITY_DN84538_c0_g1_i1.p1  ORF type:complete len:310 (+),score=30.08 TRINITY_DN84538_c0_g1_i1:62-991(+)